MEQGRAVPEGLNEGSLARIAWNSGNSGSRPVGYGMIGTPSGGLLPAEQIRRTNRYCAQTRVACSARSS